MGIILPEPGVLDIRNASIVLVDRLALKNTLAISTERQDADVTRSSSLLVKAKQHNSDSIDIIQLFSLFILPLFVIYSYHNHRKQKDRILHCWPAKEINRDVEQGLEILRRGRPASP